MRRMLSVKVGHAFGIDTSDIRGDLMGVKSIEIARIEIKPKNQDYGGEFYTVPVNRRVYPVSDASENRA